MRAPIPPISHYELSAHLTRIFLPGRTSAFLVKGSERAALIDTGAGIGDIKAYVENLTDLPYDVILTHGHIDHSAGCPLFDKVWLHPADIPNLSYYLSKEVRLYYLGMYHNVTESDLFDLPAPEVLPLREGQIFELGGVSLEICPLPGHTPGSITVLLREERTMLLGDACCPYTCLQYPLAYCVKDYRASLQRFADSYSAAFDTAWFSHGFRSQTPAFLQEGLALCQQIMDGLKPAVRLPKDGVSSGPMVIAMPIDEKGRRIDGGSFNIVYYEDRIYS